jgi:hypothetical protein
MHAADLLHQELSPTFAVASLIVRLRLRAGKCGTKNPKDKRLGNGVCDDDLNTGGQPTHARCCVQSLLLALHDV